MVVPLYAAAAADDDDNNNNNNGSRGMEEVAPLYGVDSALVILTNPGVQQGNLRHKPSTSLHTRPSVPSE